MTSLNRPYDIAVVGAGAAGLATAAALKQAAPGALRVVVIDPRPRARDGRLRTVALATGSVNLLERVGAWSELQPRAQPILEMAIYDGGVRDSVRLEQLRFEADGRKPALAHMAFNDDLVEALANAAEALGVETIQARV